MTNLSSMLRRPLVWVSLAAIYIMPLLTLDGAVDMFLKINGIAGESQDKSHSGEIDVLAWSWGTSNSGTTHIDGGAGSGKVSVQDLSLTKYVDKASPSLLLRTMDGKHIPDATLVVRKAGENPVEYIKIVMTDLIVTSISTGGSGGEDRLTENVTLNFSKVEFTYTPDDSKGTAEPSINWDIAANKSY